MRVWSREFRPEIFSAVLDIKFFSLNSQPYIFKSKFGGC